MKPITPLLCPECGRGFDTGRGLTVHHHWHHTWRDKTPERLAIMATKKRMEALWSSEVTG